MAFFHFWQWVFLEEKKNMILCTCIYIYFFYCWQWILSSLSVLWLTLWQEGKAHEEASPVLTICLVEILGFAAILIKFKLLWTNLFWLFLSYGDFFFGSLLFLNSLVPSLCTHYNPHKLCLAFYLICFLYLVVKDEGVVSIM